MSFLNESICPRTDTAQQSICSLTAKPSSLDTTNASSLFRLSLPFSEECTTILLWDSALRCSQLPAQKRAQGTMRSDLSNRAVQICCNDYRLQQLCSRQNSLENILRHLRKLETCCSRLSLSSPQLPASCLSLQPSHTTRIRQKCEKLQATKNISLKTTTHNSFDLN